MEAERRDEMARQERYDEQQEEEERGEFPLEHDSRPDQMDTDSAILDDLMESRTELRDWLECPLCLGIIKKARTVVDCMHRFCTECIEQVLEKGMHDCPVCRLHIPSRRSIKDDPLFDGLVGAICQVVQTSGKEGLGVHIEESPPNAHTPKFISLSSSKQQAKRRWGGSSCSRQHAYSGPENNNLQSTELQESDNNEQTAPTDECGKQTKVRKIIGSPSNQTSTSDSSVEYIGCTDPTQDYFRLKNSRTIRHVRDEELPDNSADSHASLRPVSGHETVAFERGETSGKIFDLKASPHEETRVGMAERIMESMVLPEVRTRVRELPIEEQDSICSNVYRCIGPYLEVLYLLEENEGEMKKKKKEVEEKMQQVKDALHSTVEALKGDLNGCQNKLMEMETHIRELGQEAKVDSLRDALSHVQSELEKLDCEKGGMVLALKEFARLDAENSSLHDTQVIADLIISQAQSGGWKMWYKSPAEYKQDLKDAVAVYYKIGKLAMKKKTCGTILDFCPSFEPYKFNLDLSKMPSRQSFQRGKVL